MSKFKAGDIVVCIDEPPPDKFFRQPDRLPIEGKVYVVNRIEDRDGKECFVYLNGDAETTAWYLTRFRLATPMEILTGKLLGDI